MELLKVQILGPLLTWGLGLHCKVTRLLNLCPGQGGWTWR